jgi:hypothetical protein
MKTVTILILTRTGRASTNWPLRGTHQGRSTHQTGGQNSIICLDGILISRGVRKLLTECRNVADISTEVKELALVAYLLQFNYEKMKVKTWADR